MTIQEIYRQNGVSPEVYAFGEKALNELKPRFAAIDEMAELSFYESKNVLLLDAHVHPNILCSHMVDAMASRCKPGVKMTYTSQVADGKTIKSNMDGLQHLLGHLLENAVRYTEKGQITLTCEEIDNKIRFSVTDTGCGIPADKQNDIFETFTTLSDKKQLNGMGLTICQTILHHLGGQLQFDKSYTDGARFYFDLPVEV